MLESFSVEQAVQVTEQRSGRASKTDAVKDLNKAIASKDEIAQRTGEILLRLLGFNVQAAIGANKGTPANFAEISGETIAAILDAVRDGKTDGEIFDAVPFSETLVHGCKVAHRAEPTKHTTAQLFTLAGSNDYLTITVNGKTIKQKVAPVTIVTESLGKIVAHNAVVGDVKVAEKPAKK